MKRRILLVVLVIALVVVAVGCGGGSGGESNLGGSGSGNNLDGRWEWENAPSVLWVEFSGNNFLSTSQIFEEIFELRFGTFSISDDEIEFIDSIGGTVWAFPFSHTRNTIDLDIGEEMILTRSGDARYVDSELNGRWEISTPGFRDNSVTFLGSSFTACRNFASNFNTNTSGAFSIQGGQIEFVGSEGRVSARPLSQTENTITLTLPNGRDWQFTRAPVPAPVLPAAPSAPAAAAPAPN